MNSTQKYLDQLIADRDTIVANINTKGGHALATDTFTELAPKILDIPSGSREWQRPSDWWDTKTILTNAQPIEQSGITYYPAYIMLLADWDASTSVGKIMTHKDTQGDAFIFSDEPTTLYVGDQTHTWDTTKDKPCSLGYKTRYIIVYVLDKTTDLAINLTAFKLIECIFGEFTSTEFIFGGPPFANQSLVNFETLDTFLGTTMDDYTFAYCFSLISVNLFNVTSVSNNAFYGCYSLTSVNLPNVTNIGNHAFDACYSLTGISLPNVTSIGEYAFSNCYSLTSINLPNVTTIYANVFQYCYSLTQLELPNSITSINKTQFTSCSNLRQLILPTDWNFELDVSSCDMPRDGLLDIISKLADITGETAKTFTFGAGNLSKLTSAEIQVATDKNWILS